MSTFATFSITGWTYLYSVPVFVPATFTDLLNQKAEAATAETEAKYLERETCPERSLIPPKEEMSQFDETTRYLDEVSGFHDSDRADTFPKTQSTEAPQFARYLIKKDLLLSRFQKFDDKQEHYLVWKGDLGI